MFLVYNRKLFKLTSVNNNMIFRNFAENLLGSKAKVKVLLYMLREELPNSERELSRLLSISNTAVHKVMLDFQDLNLVSPWRVGAANLWRLNTESYAYKLLSGQRALSDQGEPLSLAVLAKNPPLHYVKNRIAKALEKDDVKVYIFGSVAKGEEEANSDIDVFIEERTEGQRSAEYVIRGLKDEFARLFGNQLRSYVVTKKESAEKRHAKIVNAAREGMMVK